MSAKTPETIKPMASKYVDRSWEAYTFSELGWWVHLLTVRAHHRNNSEKRAKDLTDAQNYLYMMQSKIDSLYPHLTRADRTPEPITVGTQIERPA